MKLKKLLTIFFLTAFNFAKATEKSYYLIGNSLTWDTVPQLLDGDTQWHVDCGKPLHALQSKPNEPCVKSSTIWPKALTDKQYDVISFQPHYGATLEQDLAAISHWVHMQKKAGFVIHTGWAFHEKRAAEYEMQCIGSGKMLHSRAYFEALLTALRQKFPSRKFSRTYAMDLLQLVADDVESGNAPFKDVQQLYRDKIHLTKGGGRYLAHNAMRQALGQPYSSKGFEGKFTPSVKDYLDSLLASLPSVDVPNPTYDLVVYGATSAGITAAVQARKMGKSVIIVGPDNHLGGLSSGGLGFTDTGKKETIGGLAREFYHRIWLEYNKPATWKWETRDSYGNKGQGTPAIDGENRTMWIFEPSIAEKVFEDFIREYKIPVHRDHWLDRSGQGVIQKNGRITAIKTLCGATYKGRMFIDATYEGDLLAAAGVDYHVGREAIETYDEDWNGVQTGVFHHRHHFGAVKKKISPYNIPGDASSGVLPRISIEHPGEYGTADKRVQAYCYRMCLTDHPENRIPFEKPENYDPSQYELLARILDAGWKEVFWKFDRIPNRKTDTNNNGPFSTDNIGMNYDYPEASYKRRLEILEEHTTYQQGLLWFYANDERVPEAIRTKMQTWGLAKDEFQDNGNWPHQIYVREARRLIGKFVMTENELLKRRHTPESVGMGSYTMDSHNVQRYITTEGYVQNEGDIGVSTRGPYQIAYGSLVPKKGQCNNLLVPVCISSSHIAFGSIRMEPVFMILGQSAATAAAIAIDSDIPVQEVPYDQLKKRLVSDGQILELEGPPPNTDGAINLDGIVVDDSRAELRGSWVHSAAIGPYVRKGYCHDDDGGKGYRTAKFKAKLKPGLYEVRLAYPPNENRATNVPVTVYHAGGETTITINQRDKATEGKPTLLGTFEFKDYGSVFITNKGTNGYVIADAVQFLRK